MIKISQACEPIMACDRHWRGLRGSLTFLLVFLAPFEFDPAPLSSILDSR